jgi:hypothetical protein
MDKPLVFATPGQSGVGLVTADKQVALHFDLPGAEGEYPEMNLVVRLEPAEARALAGALQRKAAEAEKL